MYKCMFSVWVVALYQPVNWFGDSFSELLHKNIKDIRQVKSPINVLELALFVIYSFFHICASLIIKIYILFIVLD